MRNELIPVEDRDRWNSALAGITHGFGHTWESCHAFSLTNRLPTYLYVFKADGVRIVCPLMLRTYEGHPDVTTPFGFSGFAGTGTFSGFRGEWYAFARRMGWVCAYIGQNPLLQPFRYWTPGDFEHGQNLYWLDLRRSDSELYSGLSRGRRYQIKRWTSRTGWLCTDRALMTRFILDNHEEFFSRLGATKTYYLSTESWRELCSQDNVELLGAMLHGRLVATMLFGFARHLADALFNVSIPEGRDAATALIWEGARRLRSRNIEFLNMGGGARAGDTVEAAKRQFDAFVRPLLHMKQVFQPGRFAELCRKAKAYSGNKINYFPLYHHP